MLSQGETIKGILNKTLFQNISRILENVKRIEEEEEEEEEEEDVE